MVESLGDEKFLAVLRFVVLIILEKGFSSFRGWKLFLSFRSLTIINLLTKEFSVN